MIKASILFLSITGLGLAVEPRLPREVKLDTDGILDISLNEKVTTVLQFKEQVSMVSGAGLTDGSTPGLVQFEHPKSSGRIVLRSLGPNGRVLMQVATGGEIFVFRLNYDQSPDSLVRLVEIDRRPNSSVPVDVSLEKVEMLHLQAKEALGGIGANTGPFIFEARGQGWREVIEGFEISVDKVGRASVEDAVVVTGRVRSTKGNAFDSSRMTASLSIGPNRSVPATKFQIDAQMVAQKQEVEFILLVIGDGHGYRANFSIRNRFGVLIELNSPPEE